MTKINEINYIENISTVLNISLDEVHRYLLGKPFTDQRRGWYLMDIAQILKLMPQPPARILDLGIGPGWTSKLFGMSGYPVVGLDIASSMIELAISNCLHLPNVELHVCDYESEINFGLFDCAVIYDALHHATNESQVIQNIYNSLNKGGMLITAEPGQGHSKTPDTLDTIKKFGTTEKDMEYSIQKKLMKQAGFSEIRQYYRLSELPLENVDSILGNFQQTQHFKALSTNTHKAGFTSIVVAVK